MRPDSQAIAANEDFSADAPPRALRVEALRLLCDVLVLSSERINIHERLFTADILNSLWSDIPLAYREEAAGRLMNFPDLAPVLVRSIVMDEFSVARPFLETVKTIPDAVLIEACDVTSDHRRVIAQRAHLSAHVIERIVAQDDAEAIIAVLKNHDTTFSPEAIENAVLKAQFNTSLQMLVLARPEFTMSHGFAMFWWVGPELRRAILSRFSIDRLFLQDALHPLFIHHKTAPDFDPVIGGVLKLVDRRYSPRGQNGEKISQEILEHTLDLAFGVNEPVFSEAIALLANIKEVTAERILKDMGGEAYAVLCKSLGVSRRQFARFLERAAARGVVGVDLTTEHQAFLHETFDSIGRDYARTIIRYWDWRSGELVARSEMSTILNT